MSRVESKEHSVFETVAKCAELNSSHAQYDLRLTETPLKGKSVLAGEAIEKGAYVLEFIGELLDNKKDIAIHEQVHEKLGLTCSLFLFRAGKGGKLYALDPHAIGDSAGLCVFINHSKDAPSLVPRVCLDEHEFPHILLFAAKDIARGEELTFDYGDRRREVVKCNPWLAH